MLVALGDHDGLQVARNKLQAHPLQLLRMILLRQRQRCRHTVNLNKPCVRSGSSVHIPVGCWTCTLYDQACLAPDKKVSRMCNGQDMQSTHMGGPSAVPAVLHSMKPT